MVDGWLGASIQSDKNTWSSVKVASLRGVPSSSGSRDAGIRSTVPENKLGKEL